MSFSKIAFSAVAAASLVSAGRTHGYPPYAPHSTGTYSTPSAPGTTGIPGTTGTTSTGATTYKMVQNYNMTNFFDNFQFFTEPDPTLGYVQYVGPEIARTNGYAGYVEDAVYLGADFATVNPENGRMSTRVTSKQAFTSALIIGDIAHMPFGPGVWPAFWTFGPGWPNSGEIDIIEGVNLETENHITLHTGPGCSITTEGSDESSVPVDPNCNLNQGKTGCSQNTKAPFGPAFNELGGGVYAMDWTSKYISVYFFPRDSIPADITADAPNPANWGTPVAKFNGGSGCDINSHFIDHNIIFNTDFCGEWAGAVWTEDPELTALAATCKEYVGANPQVYAEAYWLINSVKIYESDAAQEETPRYPSSSSTVPTGSIPTGLYPSSSTTTSSRGSVPTGLYPSSSTSSRGSVPSGVYPSGVIPTNDPARPSVIRPFAA
ncbi:putative endo-1 3(4)-beta-glucanase [Ceratocystis lukuohia]|uniref:Endo-1 3(4)-beta-glucanase n=1 Tax=Ceratocystis lukuohia TaxID=2019550 RepID=A0ABR4MNB0_9PEZI